MRWWFLRVAPLAMLAGCTFTSSTTDPNLPGVAGMSSDLARAQFASMVVQAARSTLEAWGATVRGEAEQPLAELYMEDAAVVQPGSDLLKGPESVRALAEAVTANASDAHASLLDIEVSDGIAYVYGAYDITPRRAGTEASRGYHVTVLRSVGRDWRVRTQLFDPRSSSAPLLDVPGETEVGTIDLGTTASGREPREEFLSAATLIAAFTRSWRERDVATMESAFTESALFQLPDAEVAARGGAIAAAVDTAVTRWPALQTTELDFTASGRLGVLLGRYTLGAGRAARAGHYVLVTSREGESWRIRSLVLD